MIKLINIKKIGDKIQANYKPENENSMGFIVVSCTDGEVLQFDRAKGESIHSESRTMCKRALLRLSEQGDIPDEWTFCWY